MSETIVIRMTGDSGDGVQLVGEQLTITAALSGREVRTLPDFPAEIRAPAGTLAGVSGFQLAMADHAIFTAGETLQVLVALNPAALKHSISYLELGGLLLINEEGFTEKEWEKAGVPSDFLETHADQFQIIPIPLIGQTIAAVEGTGLSHAQAKKAKNFYVLGVVLWLFDLSPDICSQFIKEKFRESAVATGNTQALLAGYNYAMTLELARQSYQLKPLERPEGTYRQLTGVEAIAMAIATLAVKTKSELLVAGYPITPSSAILHACAKLESFGVALFQAEDEIAAMCACLGAAYGGKLALTCTSGPGFDLKTEALGLAVVTELPVVVIDVQRAGASTGMPTKTGQSDLRQALYGRHGESPIPVIAAVSPSDCFQTLLDAFIMATTYMTPVIVLLDAYLVNAAEPWLIPDVAAIECPVIQHNRFPTPYQRDEVGSRSWNIPGTPGFIHQLGGLEKQGERGQVSYDADNHELKVKERAQKVAGIAKSYKPLVVEGDPTAPYLVIGWGSTEGSIKMAYEACLLAGVKLAIIQLRHIHPLPLELDDIIKQYQRVFVVELNTGHLWQVLRARYLVDAHLISQCNGQPFSVKRLTNAILEEVQRECV